MKKLSKKMLSFLLASVLIIQSIGLIPAYADDEVFSDTSTVVEDLVDTKKSPPLEDGDEGIPPEDGEDTTTPEEGEGTILPEDDEEGTPTEEGEEALPPEEDSFLGMLMSALGGIMPLDEGTPFTDFTIENVNLQIVTQDGPIDIPEGRIEKDTKFLLSYNVKLTEQFNIGNIIYLPVPEELDISIVDALPMTIRDYNGNELLEYDKVDKDGGWKLSVKALDTFPKDSILEPYVELGLTELLLVSDLETIINIPVSNGSTKTFTVKYYPGGTDKNSIDKNYITGEDSKSEITWNVVVNKRYEALTNVVLVDKFDPTKLTYQAGSAEVYEAVVNPADGTFIKGTDVTDTFNPSTKLNTDSEGFTFVLGAIDKAYIVEYKTDVIRQSSDTAVYSNTVHLEDNGITKGTPVTKDKTITFDPRLTKSGKAIAHNSNAQVDYNTGEIEWTIEVNESGENLSNVSVIDTLPDGVDKTSPIAVTINGETQNITPSSGKITVTLGNITDKQTIKYKTKITNMVPGTANFTNSAVLVVDGSSEDPKTATVTVYRGDALRKSGSYSINSNDPTDLGYIEWTVYLNTGQNMLETGTNLVDILPVGTVLDGSIDIHKITQFKVENGVIKEKDATSMESASTSTITATINTPSTGKFTIDIVAETYDAFKITYKTKVIHPSQANPSGGEKFINKIGFGNDGTVGEVSAGIPDNASSQNTIDKTGTVDYQKGVINWSLTIYANKDHMISLVVKDMFKPGLTYVDGTMTLTGAGFVNNAPVADSDIDIEADKSGFEINLFSYITANANPTKTTVSGTYTLKYQTKIDRTDHASFATLTAEQLKADALEFENGANAKWTESKTGAIEHTKDVSEKITINQTSRVNGKKEVLSVSPPTGNHVNKADRTITWGVYLNFNNEPITDLKLVEEDIEANNQKLLVDTIEVYTYDITNISGATTTLANIVSSGALVPNDGSVYMFEGTPNVDGFTMKFVANNDESANKRYVVVYKTEIDGENLDGSGNAIKQYENIAKVTDKEKTVELKRTATNNFETDKMFVFKKLEYKIENPTFIGWEVLINQSLTKIEDAVIKDTLTKGHIYVEDSIKVIDPNLPGTPEVHNWIKTIAINEDGTESLTISFTETINREYKIIYDTKITVFTKEELEPIANEVALSGNSKEIKTTKIESKDFINWNTAGVNIKKALAPEKEIRITKTDETSDTLISGVTFELLYENRKNVLDNLGNPIIGATVDGILTFSNLENGEYIIRETAAPTEYNFAPNVGQEFAVTIDETVSGGTGGTPKEVTITNTKQPSKDKKIEIIKVDSRTDLPIANVEFKLYKQDDENTVIQTKTTDENGRIEFTGLQIGTYIVKETKHNGYYLADDVEITITDATTKYTETIENDPENDKKVIINKVNNSTPGKPLAGIGFTLYDEDGTTVVKSQQLTDSNGQLTFTELESGTYTVKETSHSGYIKADDFKVTVSDDDKVVTEVVVNTPVPSGGGGGGGGSTPKEDPKEDPKEEPKEDPKTPVEEPENPVEEPEIPGEEETPEEPILPVIPPTTVIPPNPTPHIPRVIEIDGVLINIDDESVPLADRLRAYEEWILINPDNVPLLGGVPKTGIGYQPIKITISDRMVETILPDSMTMNRKDKKKEVRNRE